MFLFGEGVESLSKSNPKPSEPKFVEPEPAAPMFDSIAPPITEDEEVPTMAEPLAPINDGMATPESEEDYSDEDLDTPPSLRSTGIAPWMKRE